jgi:HK97 family phage major capsid protein
MSEDLIKATQDGLKSVEVKVGEALAKYEGQLKEAGDVAVKTREELKSLSERHRDLSDAFTSMAQKGVKMEKAEAPKSFGQEFIASDAYKNLISGASGRARIELKNTIIGEGGSPVDPVNTLNPADRMPGVVAGAFRSLSLLDFIPTGTTNSNLVEYTKDDVFTNDAAETREAADKPESDQTFALVSVPVRTIAHFLKISKQVMDDAPAVATYIDQRLRHGVLNRLQTQIVNGNGTSPNIAGILASGNSTTVTAATGDTGLDFANKLKYAVIAAEYTPNVYFINPADWGKIERLKKDDASYIASDGVVSYVNNGLTPTLWGLPVVASNAVPSGTLICASSDAMMMWQRAGVVVEAYEQDDDNVQKNLVTIRAEMRGAFSVFRATAIQKGTIPT